MSGALDQAPVGLQPEEGSRVSTIREGSSKLKPFRANCVYPWWSH